MPEALYNHFTTIAEQFEQAGAKCIYVPALSECSHSVQCFERKYTLKAKQVAPFNSLCFVIYHKLQMDFLDNSIHS